MKFFLMFLMFLFAIYGKPEWMLFLIFFLAYIKT